MKLVTATTGGQLTANWHHVILYESRTDESFGRTLTAVIRIYPRHSPRTKAIASRIEAPAESEKLYTFRQCRSLPAGLITAQHLYLDSLGGQWGFGRLADESIGFMSIFQPERS